MKVVLVATGGLLCTLGPAMAGNCRDPWITQAIREVTGREPNGANETGECTYTQYGGGSWNSYAQLKGYVQARLGRSSGLPPPSILSAPGIMPSSTFLSLPRRTINGQPYVLYNGQWAKIVAQGGGNYRIISNDGGSIVAQGGGN
jgi:hypothetical protein